MLSEKETWVFSLNHDLYMECLAVDLGIPITYGDTGNISFPIDNRDLEKKVFLTCSDRNNLNINNIGFFKGEFGINLVKLHGGLSELEYKDRSIVCNQSLKKINSLEVMTDFNLVNKMAYYYNGWMVPSGGKDRWITNSDGELDIICKSMLTGGNKYKETIDPKEGEEKLNLLDDVLQRSDTLTIIGYGFGDKHINNRISKGMYQNENLQIIIIDPQFGPEPDFLTPFNYGNRIRRTGCGAANWLNYIHSRKWDYEQRDGVKQNEHIREEIKEKIKSFFLR